VTVDPKPYLQPPHIDAERVLAVRMITESGDYASEERSWRIIREWAAEVTLVPLLQQVGQILQANGHSPTAQAHWLNVVVHMLRRQ